jgi:hypothetical protein
VLDAVPPPGRLDEPDGALDCRRRIVFEAVREREVEEDLGIVVPSISG